MQLSLSLLLCCAAAVAAKPLMIRLNPSNVRSDRGEPDYEVWKITAGVAAAATFDGVSLALASLTSAALIGASNKVVFTRMAGYLGEKVIAEGITTESTTGEALVLSLKGLAAGNHTLLSYHNAWDALASASALSVEVDGKVVVKELPQTIRKDNIWESASSFVKFSVSSPSQEVKITYTPTGSSTAGQVFLNALELDHSEVKKQASFPSPSHTDSHVDGGGKNSLTATWQAPRPASGVTFNVYFSSGGGNMALVGEQRSQTSILFKGLNTRDIYNWRVDVIYPGGETVTGRIWTFRLRELAFPGAEGWGRYARGGKGAKIVRVTSLGDNLPTEAVIPGTLRAALVNEVGPRTIVFDVGGVITLQSRLIINQSYITVAGQTAPGKGIAIQGWPVGLSGASDVIIRHLRVRPGKISGATVDGMGMQGSNHAIFDRCSMGWSMDEAFSSRSAFNITLQRSMISEPLNQAGHKNYPAGNRHGYAASIGGDVGSFHHNLIAHAWGRSWSMAGGLDAENKFAGRLDLRNNVVYNFGNRVTDGGASKVNFVGNYYKPGPASIVNFTLKATYEDNYGGAQQYHCAGNSMPGVFGPDAAQVVNVPLNSSDRAVRGACWAKVSISPPPTYQKFFDKQFFESFVETQSAYEAYKRVLSDSGVQYPVQDDHDKRIIQETKNGTTTFKGSASGLLGLIDHPDDAGGLEAFPTTNRPKSSTDIPAWWTASKGAASLEAYLDFLADPHFFARPSTTTKFDLLSIAAGFVKPSFQVSATKGSATVAGNILSYAAGGEAAIGLLTVTIKDAEGSTWIRTVGIAITNSSDV